MRNATKVGPLLFCLLILSCALPLEAGKKPVVKKEKDPQTVFADGQKLFRNSDYTGAIRVFSGYSIANPRDPKGPWMELKARCMKFRADSNADEINGKAQKLSDAAYAKAILLAESAIRLAEEKIANDEEIGFYQFVQADTHGLRAIFQRASGSISLALADAKRMKELAQKSGYQDAKYLLGLAEYELSLKGLAFKIGGLIEGFSWDREDALRLIHEAEANNVGQFSDDIRLLMFQILTDTKRLKDKDRLKAEEIFGVSPGNLYRRLKAAYPKNELILRYERGRAK